MRSDMEGQYEAPPRPTGSGRRASELPCQTRPAAERPPRRSVRGPGVTAIANTPSLNASTGQCSRLRRCRPDADRVVLHLLDLGEEGLDRGEELPESGAGPKALLMALDRVPLDAHHEPL